MSLDLLVLEATHQTKLKALVHGRLGAMSKPQVSTPKSFNFVPKSTVDTKKLHLKVDNHPLIEFLVL